MGSEESTSAAEQPFKRIRLRVAWLCGAVLFLEGYDIAAAGNAIPSLVDAWKLRPAMFTQALTAGNVGLLIGSVGVGWLGDRLRRKPLLIGCVFDFGIFSLFSALVHSPMQLAALRFLTGLGLGGGIPLAIAIATDFAPQISQGRFVLLTNAGIPIGLALGGLMASQLVHFFSWRAIFVAGGVLPLVVAPMVALLPNMTVLHIGRGGQNSVAALFHEGRAPTTLLLWAINLLSLLVIYFILLWMPAILHSAGASPIRAVLSTSVFSGHRGISINYGAPRRPHRNGALVDLGAGAWSIMCSLNRLL